MELLKRKGSFLWYGIGAALCLVALESHGQNYVSILPTDSHERIIEKAANIKPSPRQLRWQQLELTAFFHFGINTFSNLEWGTGKEDAGLFNPAQLNTDQWVKTMKDAGFKQVILTAKHHDGFCLWPTQTTSYSVANSPYKNGRGDVVKNLSQACKKYQMGFGLYLSPWDRNSKFYGDSVKYNNFFVAQLTELLTRYGKVDEVWFDGANGEGANGKKQWYDFNRYYALIRKLQPQAVIAVMGPDVRWVGTESGVGRPTEWSVLPLDATSQKAIAAGSQKELTVKPSITGHYTDTLRGSRKQIYEAPGLVWYPAETDVSIRPGWFYHTEEDKKIKSAKNLMNIYMTSVGRNGVLLLNVPPDRDGLINGADVQTLQEFKRLYDRTFSINLAENGCFESNNGIGFSGLTDNKIGTFFTTRNKDTTTQLLVTLPKEVTFDIIKLQENINVGQRIENFEVDAWLDGKWQVITSGTTVGYKRLIRLKSKITTAKLRVNVLSSRLNPTIAEFGLFNAAF